jgi:para-aminobenzoate synthetase component 1
MVRRTLRLEGPAHIRWQVLADQEVFLYRRVADQDRAVLGVGVSRMLHRPVFDASGTVLDWTFGLLAYDGLEALEPLRSRHPEDSPFPRSSWFHPRWVFERRGAQWKAHVPEGEEEQALRCARALFTAAPDRAPVPTPLEWAEHTPRPTYLERAHRLMAHIARGDIYEVNYCVRRTAQAPHVDPFRAFAALERVSDAPFAGFLRMGEAFALCASPERFLAFHGRSVLAEPMKGTRPRGADAGDDERLRTELATDPKERSENIMAVDVARHDLSRTAAPGSVHVAELCGVRTHPQVHQLVSRVVSERAEGVDPWDVLRAAFPMASMTGAPKLRAMQLIDAAEDQRRGLFSGTMGFFAPDGTGDLNVVIRTVVHDRARGLLSLHTGSALTALCDPVQEYAECVLKARSVTQALRHAG